MTKVLTFFLRMVQYEGIIKWLLDKEMQCRHEDLSFGPQTQQQTSQLINHPSPVKQRQVDVRS